VSAKRHKHVFSAFYWYFGNKGSPDRSESHHVHSCFDEDCDRVLIGTSRKCDGDISTHDKETL
jgi:hypothetical protein